MINRYLKYKKHLRCAAVYFITGFFLPVLLSACANKKNDNRLADSGLLQISDATPEIFFLLDSTMIGVITVAEGLEVPWEILWGPDNQIWLTEIKGVISKVDPATGKKKVLLEIPEVYHKRTYGLLGMALHPDMKENPYLYVDYTYATSDSLIFSKLVRYTCVNDKLIDPLVLLDSIPGATGHNGSRIKISPDYKIIMTTGDALVGNNAQDLSSLSGKVLRINLDGSIPEDNPDKNSYVLSYGHRNHQGLVYAANGKIYTTEHGTSHNDELNLIRKSGNYGWPHVEGMCDEDKEKAFCNTHHVTEPLIAWTPTIAPAGMDYYHHDYIPEWKNSLIAGMLKDCSIRVLRLSVHGEMVVSEDVLLKEQYGRIRDVCVSPSGEVFLATSNRDWNPNCGTDLKDDRILRLFKIRSSIAEKLMASAEGQELKISEAAETGKYSGKELYKKYCVACHQNNGEGLPGVFPPLAGTARIKGEKKDLINILLKGLSGPIEVNGIQYDQPMPAFEYLDDREIAAILSYIRTDFGMGASKILPREVAELRN